MYNSTEKQKVLREVKEYLQKQGFTIIKEDLTRPWGGFFYIDENQLDQFLLTYFPTFKFSEEERKSKLSPKILVVEPEKRLSWQYHDRRSEIWNIAIGPVQVVTSDTNDEKHIQVLETGMQITIPKGTRHRLIGREKWGVVAEIWHHTDSALPSDEEDIVRVQDDFGR